jgi:4-hydroxybenzoate polyprenyltransferase
MPAFRTLLVLGRVSNLPTVWSNCLAGWLLAGGGDGLGGGGWGRFALLTFGASCLYAAGMFLNDAFDAAFDRQHRPERPIPSGAIRAESVWALGTVWLGLGMACFLLFEKDTIVLALALTLAIVLYDAVHKLFAFSPVLMAGCRFFLLLTAASAGRDGVTGLAIWSALALGAYVTGLSYLARRESAEGTLRFWPCLPLAAPVVLGLIVNGGEYFLRGVVVIGIVGIWVLRCLRFAYGGTHHNIGRSVAGLLAGIPLVDLLAVGGSPPAMAGVLAGLFVLSLLGQRFVPAT